jgi:hypothetical protein
MNPALNDPPHSDRLPLLGESTVPRASAEAGPGQALAPQPPDAPVAPVVVIHGVGSFAPGDVIGEIARMPAFTRGDGYVRETAYVREHSFTLLRRSRANGQGLYPARLVEVNWSEVRRAMPNALGLARHFVFVLLALMRIGVHGAWRSPSLSVPLVTGPLALWLVEGVLVWFSLAPALSALLWQLDAGQRMAAGVMVALGCVYAGALLRSVSLPMAAGAMAFAAYAAAGGAWTCFFAQGHLGFARASGMVHTLAVLLAAGALALAALEVLGRALRRAGPKEPPGPGGGRGEDEEVGEGGEGLRSGPAAGAGQGLGRWLPHFARLGCLWLPLVLLIVVQPLTVAVLLLTMSRTQRDNWGTTFAEHMLFSPQDGERAASLVAWSLAAALVLGAVLFKAVQRFGRNEAVVTGWGAGLALLVLARVMERGLFDGCAACQACLRTDWLGIAGVLLVLGASLTWILFSRADVSLDAGGRAWYPAGAFARFWAAVLLVLMPLVLVGTLGGLLWSMPGYQPTPDTAPNAAGIFLGSTKYALLLLPLATRPFAAFLDALGDVFFFLVRQRGLNTRSDTQPRLWQALRHVDDPAHGDHIVLLAHSQGTVIAAAVLSRIAAVLLRSRLRVTLITMGSPVTTLYRNFLGAEVGSRYAQLCKRLPQRFAWVNLCRPADYIGGAVELPGVVNRELLTPGDHVGYWCDPVLLRWVRTLSAGPR